MERGASEILFLPQAVCVCPEVPSPFLDFSCWRAGGCQKIPEMPSSLPQQQEGASSFHSRNCPRVQPMHVRSRVSRQQPVYKARTWKGMCRSCCRQACKKAGRCVYCHCKVHETSLSVVLFLLSTAFSVCFIFPFHIYI